MRRAAILAGAMLLAALWLGPLPSLAARSFAAHMTLHMGVVAVAAPLIAAGLAVGGWRLAVERWIERLATESSPVNCQPSTANREHAVFRLRRVSSPLLVPFPENCLANTNRPPSPKPTDGAGTRHLIGRPA